MVSGIFANLSNYVKPLGMRRIVETHRHLRESQGNLMAMFLSLNRIVGTEVRSGLYQPHTDKVTMPRTGNRQPPSCGKGPTAVGESVMMLPGIPQKDRP